MGVIVTGGRHHVVSTEDLAFLARTLAYFPGDEITEDLLAKVKKRQLRIIETPGPKIAQRPMMDGPYAPANHGPSHRAEICP